MNETESPAQAFLETLEKMPTYDGVSFRGRTADALFTKDDQVVVTKGLVASSQDIRIATENISSAGLYAVVGTAGRSIASHSQHPDEREIVFLPSTMFLVVESWTAQNIPVTVVEQLNPDHERGSGSSKSIDEIRILVRNHVEKALERPDVPIHSPGKFLGSPQLSVVVS